MDAEWLAPRPNTDTELMLGLAHTLYREGLHDAAFLERYCTGFDAFLPYLTGASDGQAKDADWAAHISGIDADDIWTWCGGAPLDQSEYETLKRSAHVRNLTESVIV